MAATAASPADAPAQVPAVAERAGGLLALRGAGAEPPGPHPGAGGEDLPWLPRSAESQGISIILLTLK